MRHCRSDRSYCRAVLTSVSPLGKVLPGFTLIELLVVVSVLVILAAILLPVVAQVRETARHITCLANLHQLGLAHRLYLQEYDETLPTLYQRTAKGYLVWPEFLLPYYRDPRLLDQGFTSPEERRHSPWMADYAMTAWGPGGHDTRLEPYWRWPGAPWVEPDGSRPMLLAEVRRPAETLQFMDGSTIGPDSALQRRHTDGIRNGVFLDGHAGLISETEWNRTDRDERGYFYTIAAADR